MIAACRLDGQFLAAEANLGAVKRLALLRVNSLMMEQDRVADGAEGCLRKALGEFCTLLQLLERIRYVDIAAFEFYWNRDESGRLFFIRNTLRVYVLLRRKCIE